MRKASFSLIWYGASNCAWSYANDYYRFHLVGRLLATAATIADHAPA